MDNICGNYHSKCLSMFGGLANGRYVFAEPLATEGAALIWQWLRHTVAECGWVNCCLMRAMMNHGRNCESERVSCPATRLFLSGTPFSNHAGRFSDMICLSSRIG